MATDHPSRFALVRLLSGEADASRDDLERHLDACPTCAAALAELREVQEAGRREAPPLPRPRPAVRRSAPRWAAAALAGAAVAAVAVIAVLPRGPGIRTKGAAVRFSCKDGPRVWICAGGEQVRPGTAIGVRASLDAPAWAVLLGRDQSGAWRSYLPADGDEAVPVEAGERDLLGHSLVLDDRPGEERFVAVIAPHPFRWQELVRPGDPAVHLPPGAQSAELVLRK